MSGIELRIMSIVSGQDGKPYVQVWLNGEEAGQLTPKQAREHARILSEAAEAAESDAFVISFLQDRVGLEIEKAASVLVDFRNFRAEQESET